MIPNNTWRRRFNALDPHSSVHNFTRPSLYEILHLLPIAYRVSSYINTERNNNREPIFDMSGIALEPPKPGPHAGVPLGGLGGGSIGRGFRGEFRRWSLIPGRYIHRIVYADVFSIRIKRGDEIYTAVLAYHKPIAQETVYTTGVLNSNSSNCNITSALTSWNWNLTNDCGTYYGLHPRAWTVYENPVPDTIVIIKQLSPFLPHNYSDSSLPCATFVVEVINTHTTLGMEASIMFSFENSDIFLSNQLQQSTSQSKGTDILEKEQLYNSNNIQVHSLFEAKYNHLQSHPIDQDNAQRISIQGICMSNTQYCRSDHHPSVSYSIASTDHALNDLDSLINIQQNNKTSKTSSNLARSNCDNDTDKTKKNQYRIEEGILSTCTKFITGYQSSNTNIFSDILGNSCVCPGDDQDTAQSSDYSYGARTLWEQFTSSGNIQEIDTTAAMMTNDTIIAIGAAICLKKWIEPMDSENNNTFSLQDYLFNSNNNNNNNNNNCNNIRHSKLFPFSLAWDHPIIQFPGTLETPAPGLPRYYTQFFDDSGLSSSKICSFALLNIRRWDNEIDKWQKDILSLNQSSNNLLFPSSSLVLPTTTTTTIVSTSSDIADDQQQLQSIIDEEGIQCCDNDNNDSYYDYQLFNELYYLVDGGTIWCNSSQGKPPFSSSKVGLNTTSKRCDNINNYLELEKYIQSYMNEITIDELVVDIYDKMLKHDIQCIESNGNQDIIGQFLYLEGHEYLMYNTYDVHFYASFALLMLWPQLELSLQRDFARSITEEDPTVRVMLGSGSSCIRKVKGYVPHDLGSPTEYPWIKSNAYNFQDVSRWKDLGPKFILQIYRNYDYLIHNRIHNNSHSNSKQLKFETNLQEYLKEFYPILLMVMKSTEEFDLDRDGMIENQGFPDQTYDVWVATGISAYCGGLWIASCEAMSKIAMIQNDDIHYHYYQTLAIRAKKVYIDKLWNGRYLNYDSSTSVHHDSIMADMMAGQWYLHACRLPVILNPEQAFSCYDMIFQHNVCAFGKGNWIGAVNGMRPPIYNEITSTTTVTSSIDNTCIQSREVWTGTTYALAAAMLHESIAPYLLQTNTNPTSLNTTATSGITTTTSLNTTATSGITTATSLNTIDTLLDDNDDDAIIMNGNKELQQSESLTLSQQKQLRLMSNLTAKGIHDGGWQKYGYWFATPEAWEQNGNYRSIGYMRPLSIWAIQFANQQVAQAIIKSK